MSATISALLAASGLPSIEAQALAAHALGLSRATLLAQSEHAAAPADARRAERLFLRRRAGEPVAYLIGEREFYGLLLKITPDVLIPRAETELLVDLALELVPEGARILDLGTGSGAVAVAIAHETQTAEVWAADASPAALAIARENARRHDAHVHVVESDWLSSLGGERFDLIVSNPPYVTEGDAHLERGDLRYEPRAALVGGADGLDCIRRIVADAKSHLVPGGWLLLEHGYDQAERLRSLFGMYGYIDVQTVPDLAEIPRVTGGRAP